MNIQKGNVRTIRKMLDTLRFNSSAYPVHEPSAKPIFILIDYYDWLEFHSKNETDYNLIYGSEFFKRINSDSLEIQRLTYKSLDPVTSEEILYNISSIEPLLKGYGYFMKELERIQIEYIKRYVYNNNNNPRIFIPFSFGINRLTSNKYHYLFKRERSEIGYTETVSTYTPTDKVKRIPNLHELTSPIIGTSATIIADDLMILPKEWKYHSNKPITKNSKIKALEFAYTNYRNCGWISDSHLLKDVDKEIFLLNQPMLQHPTVKNEKINIIEGQSYPIVND